MTKEQNVRLEETLKADRQWLRPQRLQHAKYELTKAATVEDKELWQAVIKANSY